MKNTHTKIEFGFGIEIDRDQVYLTGPERRAAFAAVKSIAVKTFGAYTITYTVGGWVNPAGVLVEEDGATLMVLIETPQDNGVALLKLAIKEYFRQEAVAVTFTSVNFSIQ